MYLELEIPKDPSKFGQSRKMVQQRNAEHKISIFQQSTQPKNEVIHSGVANYFDN